LTAPIGRSGFSSRASMKQPHHFSAPRRRQLENGQIDAGSNGWWGLAERGWKLSRR
jgi:hypothetical protein